MGKVLTHSSSLALHIGSVRINLFFFRGYQRDLRYEFNGRGRYGFPLPPPIKKPALKLIEIGENGEYIDQFLIFCPPY